MKGIRGVLGRGGAQTGLTGIPQRLLDGLQESPELQRLARELASRVGEG